MLLPCRFVLLLTCLVLQTDARGLLTQTIGTRDDLGLFQAVVTVASVPLVVFIVGRHVLEVKEEATGHLDKLKGGEDGKFVNPMVANPAADDETDEAFD